MSSRACQESQVSRFKFQGQNRRPRRVWRIRRGSYSYSYSKRWVGVCGLGVWLGSSTSTALRAEYEYEHGRGPAWNLNPETAVVSADRQGLEPRPPCARAVSARRVRIRSFCPFIGAIGDLRINELPVSGSNFGLAPIASCASRSGARASRIALASHEYAMAKPPGLRIALT